MNWYNGKNKQNIEIYNNTDCTFEEEQNVIYPVSIDLNTATVEELASLAYIGEQEAEAIVKYREKNGDFERVQDVRKVDGITIIMEKIIAYNCFIG